MTRLVHRPIDVEWFGDGYPKRFRDALQTYVVHTVIDDWIEMGEWWNGEESRRMVRLLTEGSDLLDIECQRQQWFIYRVWD